MSHRPLLIVITPVRNEAWVLEAFLTHCSSWADHIIIADQYSTDGSREICARFPKVKIIDNPTREWVEYKCRARLLEEASKIEGDKIIFALDADEFLSEGFDHTEGWQHIMESKPNEIFCFNWLNLYDDFCHTYKDVFHAEWAAHFDQSIDIVAEYTAREKNSVHSQRVPCLDKCKYTDIDDILFVHLAKLNHRRTQNKMDFYQVVSIDKNPLKANPVSMYRAYNNYYPYPYKVECLPEPIRLYCPGSQTDCRNLVQESDNGQHYIDEIVAIIKREGYKKFDKLGIWDNPDLIAAGITHTPPLRFRILHKYLKFSQQRHNLRPIKVLDKIIRNLF